MPERAERTYCFHGVGIEVIGEPRLLEPLDDRLKLFRSSAPLDSAAGLTFELVSGNVRRPSWPARPVYDPEQGEVVYDDLTDELHLVFDDRLGAVCYPLEGWTRISVTDPSPAAEWRVSHPLLTLPLIEMLKRRGLFSLHAAGVSRNGRGVLLVGASGSGKTTLSLALIRAGFDFLGDDMVFLSDRAGDLQVCAFPDEVDVTEQTARFFPELQFLLARERRPGWPKWAFRAEAVFDAHVAWTCRPAAIVFPRVGTAETSRLEPLRADQALLEMAPNVLLTEPRACQEHLDILARLANETPCFRLSTGRDFVALPELLGQLVQ
jgi:hypothetical protein